MAQLVESHTEDVDLGAPGGIVNYVLKRPTDDPYRSFSVGYQSAGIFSEKLDVGGRFGKDDRFGYRFNVANEEGNTAEANGHVRRKAASLALDFRITPDLTWAMDGLYQKRKTNGTLFGIYLGSGVGVPDAGSISRSLTQPQNFYQTEMASFGTGLEYKISPNWKANIKYRFAKENRTESDSQLSVFNNAGDYTNTLYAALTRYFYQNVDAMVQGTFNTGSFKHDMVVVPQKDCLHDALAVGEALRFTAELRPYQRQGLAWLQRLRANGLSGCLGDDMGLGKTAQTIAHIILEHQEVNSPGPDRSVVFQNHSLLPWLSVYDNVNLAVTKLFSRSKTGAERHDYAYRPGGKGLGVNGSGRDKGSGQQASERIASDA